ncbi:uncharacterized protein VP01_5271g2 [Puccinia sorghi]|uniref:Uncharacterized protein n=1 Tax=Puccinia sorghi TaxID=27349 RepID=A0A0L6UL55_9BASI|nr:uncharacterized protein VP01_5271g2 [Puccinia sorghi]
MTFSLTLSKFMSWYIWMISLSTQITSTIILYAKLLKCKFHNSSLQFLGVIVSSYGIRMDPVNAKKCWIGTRVKTLQGFLVFANFYQKIHYKLFKNHCQSYLPSLKRYTSKKHLLNCLQLTCRNSQEASFVTPTMLQN